MLVTWVKLLYNWAYLRDCKNEWCLYSKNLRPIERINELSIIPNGLSSKQGVDCFCGKMYVWNNYVFIDTWPQPTNSAFRRTSTLPSWLARDCQVVHSTVYSVASRELQWWQQLQKGDLKSEFVLLQSWRRKKVVALCSCPPQNVKLGIFT